MRRENSKGFLFPDSYSFHQQNIEISCQIFVSHNFLDAPKETNMTFELMLYMGVRRDFSTGAAWPVTRGSEAPCKFFRHP